MNLNKLSKISTTSSAPILVEAHNLHYRLGARFLIQKLSIQIRPGEIVAIIGPNGAGKSTLINYSVATYRRLQVIVIY